MSKAKTKEIKKVLVRNSVQAVPKTVSSKFSKTPEQKQLCTEMTNSKSATSSKGFDRPEVYSTSKILKKIEEVENLKPRKMKSASTLEKGTKLAVDEKITKLVNFPPYEPIYKDLIPLCTRHSDPPTLQLSREPQPLKDIEPCLSDFIKPKQFPEYTYQISIASMAPASIKQFNGVRLTNIIKTWDL